MSKAVKVARPPAAILAVGGPIDGQMVTGSGGESRLLVPVAELGLADYAQAEYRLRGDRYVFVESVTIVGDTVYPPTR